MRVFIGYDPRQPLGYNVLQHSIHRNSLHRVQVEPLLLHKLPIKRRGLTEFTYSRFLVPYLCGYEGAAVFMDADIVVTGDIARLFEQLDESCSVQVMQQQKKFEWPSVMLFNNARCKTLTPDYIENPEHSLMKLEWAEKVGSFSADWNHCVGYTEPAEASLYHYTQGLPCWHETKGLPEDKHWQSEYEAMIHTVTWGQLMANSVHAEPVIRRMIAGYGLKMA
jgi:lipopolysaccharide biosynthesis glycosyltransferase